MPPKRKALAELTGNKSTTPRNSKASKRSPMSSAPKSKTYKYCNADTLSKKPTYINLQWPNFHDFCNDKNQDVPKEGELVDEYCTRVSDLGIPVSEDGMKVCEKLDTEMSKRDQDERGMYIYEDWNGWATSEVMTNLLKDFNKDLFKKNISPFKKWSYIEGLACFLKGAELTPWMMNEDGPGVKTVVDMLGLMILTSYDVLSEHDLLKPESELKNIEIVSLLILEFLSAWASDLDCTWGCEIVRLCDEAGIQLDKHVRKQVSVSKEEIKDLRAIYAEKKEASEYAEDEESDGNGYKAFALKKDWSPEDDVVPDKVEDGFGLGPERLWYRWDWKLEYGAFAKNHPGGSHYDLTKMSKKERKSHTL